MSDDSLYPTLSAAIRAEAPIALATVTEGPNVGAKLLVRPDHEPLGSLGDNDLDRVVVRDVLGELAAGRTGIRRYGAQGQAREDTVAVFIAGHGETGTDGNYYFLPTDIDRDGGFDAVGTGRNIIDWSKIQDRLTKSLGRTLIFLDSCQSGAAGAARAYNARLLEDARYENFVATTYPPAPVIYGGTQSNGMERFIVDQEGWVGNFELFLKSGHTQQRLIDARIVGSRTDEFDLAPNQNGLTFQNGNRWAMIFGPVPEPGALALSLSAAPLLLGSRRGR